MIIEWSFFPVDASFLIAFMWLYIAGCGNRYLYLEKKMHTTDIFFNPEVNFGWDQIPGENVNAVFFCRKQKNP